MKIKNRLTFLYTILISVLLIIFAIVIYISHSENRKEEYYKILKQQAITKTNLLLDAKVAPEVLQLIYKNFPNSLFQEEVAIYDTSFQLLYHDAVEIDKVKETKQMIDEIINKKEIRFEQEDMQVVGFFYEHNGKQFVITAAAVDEYGYAELLNLKYLLLLSTSLSILLTFFVSRFFSIQALKPVAEMVNRVEEITATNLDLRLDEGKYKDEIYELGSTFNQMLDRLENSFDAQKKFVADISHELRTPLTSMMTELELTINKPRTSEEYRESINHAINDAQRLVKLSNGLLDFAKASYDSTEINFKEVRLDEILLDARRDVIHDQPLYKVNIIFEREIEDDDFISVKGNEYLLKVAFMNLMENGCKFSVKKESNAAITYVKDRTILRFSDKGIGIAEEDLPNIFISFYRGHNKKYVDGNGIGLSLVYKIIKLHKGDISVISKVNEGATFIIEIPHL